MPHRSASFPRLTFVLSTLTLIVLGASQAQAECPAMEPFGNLFGDYIADCADQAPVSAYAFALGPAGVIADSGGSRILCRSTDDPPPQGSPDLGCAAESGSRGDGQVTLRGDWGLSGVNGCPNPNGEPGVGRNVFVVRDFLGGSVIVSVGYDPGSLGYPALFAGPADLLPLGCRAPNGATPASMAMHLLDAATLPDGTFQAVVQVVAPRVFSDCDPGSAGISFGMGGCTEGSLQVGTGHVYTARGPCTGPLDLRVTPDNLSTPWTISPRDDLVSIPIPSDGRCAFVAATFTLQGIESPAVVSGFTVAGALAPPPKALDVRAVKAVGAVTVTWRTDSEIGLAGFAIVTSRPGEGPMAVASQEPLGNGGGHSYSLLIPLGDFKGGKSVVVRSLQTNGFSIDSDPARFRGRPAD